jgi:hypothetical protein
LVTAAAGEAPASKPLRAASMVERSGKSSRERPSAACVSGGKVSNTPRAQTSRCTCSPQPDTSPAKH